MASPASRVAFYGLLMFTLVLPIENVLVLPEVGSLSVLTGIVMVAASVPAFVTRGNLWIRRQAVAVVLLAIYVLWALAGLLWSIDPPRTIVYATTFSQLLVFLVICWQVCTTEVHRSRLQTAYLIGCALAVLDGLRNFIVGNEAVFQRFAVSNTDPNDYALTLVLGIPMAWELFAAHRGPARLLYVLFVPVALFAVILSASRGGALAAAVALLVFPIGFHWLDRAGKRILLFLFIAAVAVVPFVWSNIAEVASSNLERLSTLGSELAGGTLNDRATIWAAGMDAFTNRPVNGVGGGAFPTAIEAVAGISHPAHNSFVSVTVELGAVGLLLFSSIIVVAAIPLVRQLGPRTFPSLVMLAALLVGVMSLTWEFRKPTWLVIALMLTLDGVRVVRFHPPAKRDVANDLTRVRGPAPASDSRGRR